jgi:hypothetical protein
MRKRFFILIISFMFLFAVANLWSEGKHEKKAVRCDISISLNWGPAPPTWKGTIDGDIKGEFDINNIGANFDYPKPDPSEGERTWEFYWEEWVIKTDDGTITSIQAGVWSFKTFKFVSNGPVVDATGKWKYLIGSTMYVSGVTTEFPVDPPTPVTGEGEMWIN